MLKDDVEKLERMGGWREEGRQGGGRQRGGGVGEIWMDGGSEGGREGVRGQGVRGDGGMPEGSDGWAAAWGEAGRDAWMDRWVG